MFCTIGALYAIGIALPLCEQPLSRRLTTTRSEMEEDGEFEVTAEMLIHEDADDELTLVEAEALESEGEVEEEMADLQQESELPLEELLKRYSYCFREPSDDVRGEEERGGEGEGEEGEGVTLGKRLQVSKDDVLVDSDFEKEVMCIKRVKVIDDLNHEALLGVESRDDKPHLNETLHTEDENKSRLSHLDSVAISANQLMTSDTILDDSTRTHVTSTPELFHSSNAITSQPQLQQPSATLSDSTFASPPSSPYDTRQHEVDTSAINSSDTARASVSPTDFFNTDAGELLLGHPLLPDEMGMVSMSEGVWGEGRGCGGGSCDMTRGEGEGRGRGCEGGNGEVTRGEGEGRGRGCEGGSGEVGGGEEGGELFSSECSGGVTAEGRVDEGERRAGHKMTMIQTSPNGYSSDQLLSSVHVVHTPATPSSSLSLHPSSTSSSDSSSKTHRDIKSRLRQDIPERRSMRLMANDEKVLDAYFAAYFEDEEGDEEYIPVAVEDWKQEIRVGSSYQVEVEDRPSLEPYPTQTETSDRLLWRPQTLEEEVASYLKTVSAIVKPDSGSNSWETEQALQLLQECAHNVQRAVDIVRQKGLSPGTKPWTEKECDDFEEGLRVHGKDFFRLKNQVPSRSVKELVEFYYFWKKSKRYDNFVQQGKIGKKKIHFQPGQVFDFMDNYLNMQDSEATDLHYATTTVYAEHRKETV